MIERLNIGIFGKMNAGKSTLTNLLTQQNTSIVDSKYGTTTDIKISLIEIHLLGPVKLFDTPGIDEMGRLGAKKKQKAKLCLKNCDLILLVINPNFSFKENKKLIDLCQKDKKSLLLITNKFRNKNNANVPNNISLPQIFLDLSEKSSKNKIINFILENYKKEKKQTILFPNLKRDDIVFLNIPMDEETPEKRLLRPQAFVQENFIRRYITTVAFRMDLSKARSENKLIQKQEKQRFLKLLYLLKKNKKIKLLITDSQAIDIIHLWTLNNLKKPVINITTFSIIMAYIKGDFSYFLHGIETLKNLKKNDKILITEACNHNRIKEDIGTIQIPNKINNYFGKNNIKIDHCFGRELFDCKLDDYKLIIHCGGCMLDNQAMQARIENLKKFKIPITNYGLVLSFFDSQKAFARVIKPFKFINSENYF